MKFKTFRFPSFKKFFNYPHELSWGAYQRIGEFQACIEVCSCSYDRTQFDFIATIRNHFNTEICYHSDFSYNTKETKIEDFETWYKQTIKELNDSYINYMIKIYTEEE